MALIKLGAKAYKAGSVIQVKKADDYISNTNISTQTFTGVGNSVSITPTTSSNKILIHCSVNTNNDTLGVGGLRYAIYYKEGSGSFARVENQNENGFITYTSDSASYTHSTAGITMLHDPQTTDTLEYKLYARQYASGDTVTVSANWGGLHLTAQEIVA